MNINNVAYALCYTMIEKAFRYQLNKQVTPC